MKCEFNYKIIWCTVEDYWSM